MLMRHVLGLHRILRARAFKVDDGDEASPVDDDERGIGILPTLPTPEPLGDTEPGQSSPIDLLYELEETLVELDLASAPSPISVDDSGRFEIRKLLGRGAMGAVYQAHDSQLDRIVALKVVQLAAPEHTHLQDRLLQEARAMARLSHPNVVHVLDIKRARSGERVIALEYIDGPTLRTWQRGRSIAEIIDAYVQVGHGLAEAHYFGVIHRDFKPDNALVHRGEKPRVVVVDFGLAGGVVDDERNVDGLLSPIESTGLGTPEYMAPEQRWRPADALCDQYAFCVSLWEAIEGNRPFSKDRTIVDELPSPPARMPVWLYWILRKGLAWEPRQRFASMGVLVRALERGRRFRAASRWVVATIAVLGLLGGIAWGLQPAPCADASVPIDRVWNERTRAELARALGASDARWGTRAAEYALDTLDEVAGRWSHEAHDVCEAERASGRSAQLDRRRGCLEQWLAQFGSRVEALQSGDDFAAAQLINVLGPLTASADMCSVPPPVLEGGVRVKLAEAETKEDSRRFEAALVDASAAVELAADAEPCRTGGEHSFEMAAANFRLGHVLGKLERWAESRAALELASRHALSCGDWWSAFDVRAYQSFVDSKLPEVGSMLAEIRLADADALLGPSAGTSGPSLERAELQRMRGLVGASADEPQFETAIAALLEARDVLEQIAAPLDLRVQVRHNLGWAHQLAGDYPEAEAAYADATQLLAHAVGPEHPQTERAQALVDINRGLIALDQEQFDLADELFSDAATRGDVVVASKAYAGWVQSRMTAGDAKQSVQLVRRYQRWLTAHPSLPDRLRAESLYVMGQSLTEASLREGGGVESPLDFDDGLAWLQQASELWAASDPDKSLTVRVIIASSLCAALQHAEAERVLDALPADQLPGELQNSVLELRELIAADRER
jgi:tetratricopeptide (TPR) repeat protein